MEPIYCLRCKGFTGNVRPMKVQTPTGRMRIATKCASCGGNKSKFTK